MLLVISSLSPSVLSHFIAHGDTMTPWFVQGSTNTEHAPFATPRGYTLSYKEIKNASFCGRGNMHGSLHVWYRKDLCDGPGITLASLSLADPRLQELCTPPTTDSTADQSGRTKQAEPQVFFEEA